MPKVGAKHHPYTPAGMKAAAKARKRKKGNSVKRVRRIKPTGKDYG